MANKSFQINYPNTSEMFQELPDITAVMMYNPKTKRKNIEVASCDVQEMISNKGLILMSDFEAAEEKEIDVFVVNPAYHGGKKPMAIQKSRLKELQTQGWELYTQPVEVEKILKPEQPASVVNHNQQGRREK